MLQLVCKQIRGGKEKMVDYLKRLVDRLDAEYETFMDDFETEYFLQKNALAMIRLRRDSGLTQAEFARNAGMTQGNLSRLENGNYNPTLAYLQKIASKNGYDLDIRFKKKKR